MIHFWIHTGGLLDLVAFQFLVFSLEGLDHFKQLRLRLLGFGNESPVDNISFRTTSLHSDAAAMWILEKLLKELASVLLLAILGMRLEVVVYASKVLKSWDSRNFLALALDGSEQAGEAEEFELSVLRSYKVGREGENQSFSSKREKTGGGNRFSYLCGIGVSVQAHSVALLLSTSNWKSRWNTSTRHLWLLSLSLKVVQKGQFAHSAQEARGAFCFFSSRTIGLCLGCGFRVGVDKRQAGRLSSTSLVAGLVVRGRLYLLC